MTAPNDTIPRRPASGRSGYRRTSCVSAASAVTVPRTANPAAGLMYCSTPTASAAVATRMKLRTFMSIVPFPWEGPTAGSGGLRTVGVSCGYQEQAVQQAGQTVASDPGFDGVEQGDQIRGAG